MDEADDNQRSLDLDEIPPAVAAAIDVVRSTVSTAIRLRSLPDLR
jgi:hypothetical protein